MAETDQIIPMPQDLRSAFHEVLTRVYGWGGAPPEPLVSLDMRPFPISAICDWVDNSNFVFEQMPDYLVAHITAEPGCPPLTDATYQSGARCVGQIIRDRLEHFQNLSKHFR